MSRADDIRDFHKGHKAIVREVAQLEADLVRLKASGQNPVKLRQVKVRLQEWRRVFSYKDFGIDLNGLNHQEYQVTDTEPTPAEPTEPDEPEGDDEAAEEPVDATVEPDPIGVTTTTEGEEG